MTKGALRREVLLRRQALPQEERRRLSLRACRRLLLSPVWNASESVVVYVSIRTEVDTAPLIEAALSQGKALFVPRVTGRGTMSAFPLRDRAALSPGFMGIPEPSGESTPGSRADLIVVPGVAFSLQGRRLGYGGGYYDRFFEAFTDSFRVGLLFGEQLVDDMPEESHDVTMDALIVDGVWVNVPGGRQDSARG